MTHPLSKHKGPYRADYGTLYDANGKFMLALSGADYVALTVALADRLNRAQEMEKALREITTASEMDCGVPTADDGDDEPVAATQAQHGPIVGSALTFGMLRRARAALPPTPESET